MFRLVGIYNHIYIYLSLCGRERFFNLKKGFL